MGKQTLVSLASLRQGLQTGDLVFFQGLASDSVLIRDITGGSWSHCAMVIRGEDIECAEHELLLFESSVTAGRDIGYSGKAGTEKAGVMLVNFDQRMEDYAKSKEYAVFGIRQFEKIKADKVDVAKLKEFTANANIRDSIYPAEHLVAAGHFVAKELENEQFSDHTVAKIRSELRDDAINNLPDSELKLIIGKTIEAAQDNIDNTAQDKTSHCHAIASHYFCSELVADALMHMGIMAMGNAAGYSPSDLSDDTESPIDSFYSSVKYVPGDLVST
mgnify:CR=1 FL=1|tara:strand:- start:232 stop:1053 length:822 start_codon:yes stop_codon:yes gene_type:complete